MQVLFSEVKKFLSSKLVMFFLILDIFLSIQHGHILATATTTASSTTAATITTNAVLSPVGVVAPFDEATTTTRSSNVSGVIIADTRTKSNAASNISRPSPSRVRLNKCCELNEYLDETQTCMPDGNADDRWVPLIFLIQQRRYHQPQGTSTKFITFVPNVLPIRTANITTTTTPDDNHSNMTRCTDASSLTYFKSVASSSNGKFVIFSNGSLYLSERSLLIQPRNYCVDRNAALVCLPQEAKALLQLKKCCGKYGSYDAANKKCTFGKHFMTSTMGKLKLPPLNESLYQTLYGLPECLEEGAGGYAVAGDWQEAKLNVQTGHLTLPHKNLSSVEYCLEHLFAEMVTTTTPSSLSGVSLLLAPPPVKIITCSHHFAAHNNGAGGNHASDQHLGSVGGTLSVDDERAQQFRDTILHFGLVISVIFLGATLVAGYMMPSVHHALHWRCQIYYVFCLFVGELLLAISLLDNSIRLDSAWCLFIASAMQFFFLSAFFWLNTMCFNIWWTFRDFRPSSLERNQELLRLRLYSAYAWGIPLLICAIAACVDQLPETQLLHPGFGVHRCWFNNERLSIFAYFFGPIGFLLCANIILFVSTTHQLTCGLWKRDDVKSTTEKTALGKVCLKLVVVMGVTWIADVISWLVGGPHSVWFFTDLVNALQGVLIFIVVGCQPQVWAAFKRICCPRLLRHDITNTTNGVQHSSSSQGLPSMGGIGGAGGVVAGSTAGTEFSTQNTSLGTVSIMCPTSGDGNAGIYVSQITLTTAATPQFKIPMETIC